MKSWKSICGVPFPACDLCLFLLWSESVFDQWKFRMNQVIIYSSHWDGTVGSLDLLEKKRVCSIQTGFGKEIFGPSTCSTLHWALPCWVRRSWVSSSLDSGEWLDLLSMAICDVSPGNWLWEDWETGWDCIPGLVEEVVQWSVRSTVNYGPTKSFHTGSDS